MLGGISMSELRFEEIEILAGSMYEDNPLPDIKGVKNEFGDIKFSEEIKEEEKESFYYGRVKTILPYCIQDNYDRDKKVRSFKACILENEYLKATFLPELGGRLYSLYSKEQDRDLVHKNPVFQPANLALRNAWFSGGVEFNIGMTGHTPFTVSPLFTAKGIMEDGTEVLRMYEWERVRKLAYCIDAYLPEGSKFLFIRITVINNYKESTPMYWWSNIAVDQTKESRIIVPCQKAYVQNSDGSIDKEPVPICGGVDRSYPSQIPYAFDQFYDIPKEERKWISALDKEGKGIIHVSTDKLLGRKLFNWGDSIGGSRWQEFLSVKGKEYFEIQAGCAHMQHQRVPMEGNSTWSWTEGYGYMEADKDIVHGEDYTKAYSLVGEKLDEMLSRERLEEIHNSFNISNVELVYEGSGWGALELERRQLDKNVYGLLFNNIGTEQEIWMNLLKKDEFPEIPADSIPAKYVTQVEWIDILENSIKTNKKSYNWHSFYQLGVMKAAREDMDGAIDAFKKSLELKPNVWSCWCLGILEDNAEYMDRALKLLPISKTVDIYIITAASMMYNRKGMYEKTLKLWEALDKEIANHPRVKLAYLDALIMTNSFDKALQLFSTDIIPVDLKEGEELLSNYWYKLHARRIMFNEGLDEDRYKEVFNRVVKEVELPDEFNFIMQYRPLT